MGTVALVRVGNLTVVDPTTRPAFNLLKPDLTYVYTKRLPDPLARAARAAGASQYEQSERVFYSTDPENRLVFPRGLTERVRDKLRKNGYGVTYSAESVKSQYDPPVDWNVPDWERVTSQFEFREGNREMLEIMLKEDYGRIDCTTGYGKTWTMGAYSLLLPRARIFVVAKAAQTVAERS